MKQTIITVFEDGTQKHPGFGSFATHTFRKDERDFVGEPSFWEEKTYTIEKRHIDHDDPHPDMKKSYGVPLHKIKAMGLAGYIKEKKEGSVFGVIKNSIKRFQTIFK
jgi:hypothetical protein